LLEKFGAAAHYWLGGILGGIAPGGSCCSGGGYCGSVVVEEAE